MALFPRVLWSDIAYHVTQRGNDRHTVFYFDHDRQVYLDHLDLPRTNCRHHWLSRLGYAAYFNTAPSSSGHVWQGRYYSCPLGDGHL